MFTLKILYAGIVGAAQADVSLHMEYQITAGQCPTIAQSIITRGQEELTVLSQNWGGEMCDAADCTDITPVVDCSVLASTTVDIQLTNVRCVGCTAFSSYLRQ